MNTALLSSPDKKEALSRVYVSALAARAGFTTSSQDFDRDGVDMRIQSGGEMRPALDLQLKATEDIGAKIDGHFSFDLKRRNYDLLRIKTQTPRLLIVLDLPNGEANWMTISSDELILRRSAYWISLANHPPTTNQSTVRVNIPAGNQLNITSLEMLMNQSMRGRIE